MHRLLFFSLALVCLLAGCSAPQASDPAPDASNDLDAYFEEEPADNEMGSAEFGLCKTRWTRFIPTMVSP